MVAHLVGRVPTSRGEASLEVVLTRRTMSLHLFPAALVATFECAFPDGSNGRVNAPSEGRP